MTDLLIVLTYFAGIMLVALSGRQGKEVGTEEYFLSSRNLRWPSIALSTIATNVHGYQFLGMMGSAYLFGLAQANLEINAIQGILLAAFIFVPLYLRHRVITITQFINKKLGKRVGLVYSIADLSLFSTLTLGSTLFWGAYAAELVFEDYLLFIHENRFIRTVVLTIGLGVFSAVYTYLGGLGAVVKTDIIQFLILVAGGVIMFVFMIDKLGGWSQLYVKTPEMMHLHLPADHEKLPWTHVFGLFLLNINYWCANQTVMQRSLAARSLREAQLGLLVGGATKYLMAILIVIPGIALAGVLGADGLSDPDQAFPTIVSSLPSGVKGIILCALFASLMSTIDSTFNSLATLWSIDIYKAYLKKDATEAQVVQAGKQTILVTLVTGVSMGILLLYWKFEAPEEAFTHTLNALRYYIISGIVVLICGAGFLKMPDKKAALFAFFINIPLHITFIQFFPEMNYFVRAFWVISISLSVLIIPSLRKGFRVWDDLLHSDSRQLSQIGWGLLTSLVLLHIIFH